MRRWLPALALASAALVLVVAPRVTSTPSTAAFTDVDALTANRVTAGACASSTTWSTRVASLDSGSSGRVWQRMTPSGADLVDESFNGQNWSDDSLDFGVAGALYCDGDPAIGLNAATDDARSASQQYSNWGANATLTMMLWIKGTSGTPGRLVSLAEGATGSSTYVDRVLWVASDGTLRFGGRWGSSSGNEFVTTTTGPTVTDGRWHLVVVQMPNTSATSNTAPTVYVDGEVAPASTSGTVRYRARSSSGSSASWYLGDNNAGRDPSGAPTAGWIGHYDEFVVTSATPTATLLGSGAGSLYAGADGR